MPRWEVHLSVTSMALVIVLTGAVFGLVQKGISIDEMRSSLPLIKALSLGGIAMIFGAVLPDIDGKGRIRWTIGPILGGFAILPPFLGRFSEFGSAEGVGFLYGEGARIFLFFTLIGVSIPFLPLKHRGLMHSILPGVIFGTAWGVYAGSCLSLGLEGAVLTGGLGTLGYLWHLSLDGELSLVR